MLRTNLLVAARNLLFQQVYYCTDSTVKGGMKRRVAQGHCVLLEKNKKILGEGFSLCNPAHCNALCTHPSINKRKNSSNYKFATAHMRSVMTPDQNLLLHEDERHPEKYPSPSGATLDLHESKSAPNSAHCVLFCSCLLDTKDNCIKFCPSSSPQPSYCKGLPHSQDT